MPVIALATVVALLVAGVLMAYYSEQSYREQKAREVTAQARVLASTVLAAVVFEDEAASQEYVNALAANPEIRAAAVYEGRGVVLASYRRTADETIPVAVVHHGTRLEDGRLVVTIPVEQRGKKIGHVYLRTVIEPLGSRIFRYGAIFLLFGMAALVVAVLAITHSALTRTNRELEMRAADLSSAYARLQAETMERERVEEALRQSQKMEAIGHLSGGIAHDFNNLLTVISGNLQLLQRRLQNEPELERYINSAMEGANRASNVTQRILAFSRRQPLMPTLLKLDQLVAGMGELIRHSVGEQISVRTRLRASGWTKCDANQMENTLLNLIINARDAMPEGGILTIETSDAVLNAGDYEGVPPGSYVRLSVADSGIGMTDEVRSKALDPFFTTKSEGQGTGLGLSMVYGFVNQSGGHLHIASAPEKGTTVTILMPSEAAPVAADEAPLAGSGPDDPIGGAPESGTGRSTVLVVEDEVFVRRLVVEAIRDEGFETIDEGDGNGALALLESNRDIDLMITDVRLPGLNGYQLAKAGLSSRPGLKVILMTGFAQEAVPEDLMRAGAKILYKPYKINDLISFARELLPRG